MAFTGQLPPPNQPIVVPEDGRPTNAFGLFLVSLKRFLSPDVGSVFGVEFVSGIIAAPTNQDYRIIEKLPYGAVLTGFTAKLASGTATATLKINGVAVTGGVIAVTAAQASAAPSAANAAVTGDAIVITISAAAAPVTLSYSLTYNRLV